MKVEARRQKELQQIDEDKDEDNKEDQIIFYLGSYTICLENTK